MRVISGKFRSRRLHSLQGLDLRPTSDRLRETLFDILTAGNPSALDGTTWLDLYAGTGAVGIEALSRGAAMVYVADSSTRAAQLIEKNIQSLGLATGFNVLKQDAVLSIQNLAQRRVQADFVFLDPPYRMEHEYSRALTALAQSKLITQSTLVIAEHQAKFDPGEIASTLRRFRLLKQGDAALSFYKSES